METGGRLAILAEYYLEAAVPSGDTYKFQWYKSENPDGPWDAISAEDLGQGNTFMPNTAAPGTTYYYAEMTYTPNGGVPEITSSDVAMVTVNAKVATSNPLSTALTPAEASGWRRTTSSAEVNAWCQLVADNSGGRIRMEQIATTAGRVKPEGFEGDFLAPEPQPVYMLVIGNPAPKNPDEVSDDKAVILVNNNIHSGEVEGKESMLIFAREVALGMHDDLLEDLVILLIPNLSATGNDILAKNRINNQYTPKLVGTRFTGGVVSPVGLQAASEGTYNANSESHNWYNLNRAMTTLCSPEAEALARLMTEWNSVIFMDAHATNGSLMQHAITYNWGMHENTDWDLFIYNRDDFSDLALGSQSYLYNEQNKVAVPYGNFSGNPSTTGTWNTFEDLPRYTTNYAGLRNRLALIYEVYSHDAYTVRVDTMYACLYGTMLAVQEDLDHIKDLIAATDNNAWSRAQNGVGDEEIITKSSRVLLDREDGNNGYLDIMSYSVGTGNSPINYQVRDDITTHNVNGDRSGTLVGEPTTYRIPYMGRFAPTATIPMGAYYLLDKDCDEAVDLLQRHGVQVSRLTEELTINAQWFKPTSRYSNAGWYEGGLRASTSAVLDGSWQTAEDIVFPVGTYVVTTAQPLGTFAALMMEPTSVDGFVSWNFFDGPMDNPTAAGTVRSNPEYFATFTPVSGRADYTGDEKTYSVPIFKVAEFDLITSTATNIEASETALPLSGGKSTITITGSNLMPGILVEASDGNTTLSGRTSGVDGASQSLYFNFPANNTSTKKVYTVRFSMDGGATWETQTTAVTVNARRSSSGGGGTGSKPATDTTPDPTPTPEPSYKPMEPTRPAGTQVVTTKTNNPLWLNGKETVFPAIKIDDYNWIKLRDFAMLLNGTSKQFSINYDPATNIINITTGGAYTPLGDELMDALTESITAKSSLQQLRFNGQFIDMASYNVNGYNYFRLRDLCIMLDFLPDYDAASDTITLDFNQPYSE